MKNQSQAKGRVSRYQPLPLEQKPRRLFEAIEAKLTCEDPLEAVSSFVVKLTGIRDTMEPEIFAGDRAVIVRKKDMGPCDGELVIGCLKSGHILFGVYHTPIYEPRMGLWQIRPINPVYPPAHYLPEHFHWLYPVTRIEIVGADGYITAFKSLEYIVTDESFDCREIAN